MLQEEHKSKTFRTFRILWLTDRPAANLRAHKECFTSDIIVWRRPRIFFYLTFIKNINPLVVSCCSVPITNPHRIIERWMTPSPLFMAPMYAPESFLCLMARRRRRGNLWLDLIRKSKRKTSFPFSCIISHFYNTSSSHYYARFFFKSFSKFPLYFHFPLLFTCASPVTGCSE